MFHEMEEFSDLLTNIESRFGPEFSGYFDPQHWPTYHCDVAWSFTSTLDLLLQWRFFYIVSLPIIQ